MKKILLCFIFFSLSVNLFAFELTEKNKESLNDLMLMPEKGKFFGETSISNQNETFQVTYLSRTFGDYEIKDSKFSQTLSYSFLDNLRAGLILDYNRGHETTVKYGIASTLNGTSVSTKSMGWYDPTYFVGFRGFNQKDYRINADIYFMTSPKMQEAKSSTSKTNGNMGKGNNVSTIGILIGKKYESFQFFGSGELSFCS